MAKQWITVIAFVSGLDLFANGVFMLVAPEARYWTVPGVPVRGSFNCVCCKCVTAPHSAIAEETTQLSWKSFMWRSQ